MQEFPPFRLDTMNQCLWRHKAGGQNERLLLRPTPFAILRYLVDHAGRLVTQNELLDAVWPDTHVQPEVLKRHILDIRSALGDDPRSPTFIETLPRRGYQFIAPIREDIAGEAVEPARLGHDKLVGRHGALGELREYLRKAVGGQRQVVFITGEPGVGKTTLVDEFQRQAGPEMAIRNARGQCVEGYGGKESYYPMLEALGKLCRGSGGESIIQVLASQAPTWLTQFPALVTREQRETLRRELLGATRERMLREIGEALETITANKPLLLVLEDLQWTDPSTVDLISALARGRAPAKLMLIGTYRPMDVSPSEVPLKGVKQELAVHRLCHEVALEALRESDVAEYLRAGASGSNIPPGLAGLVHRHSEGNPLFMVAALEHMTQRGFISQENGTWKLNVPIEEIDLEVPESLRQMIEAQIERLSVEQQRALEVASVRGVSFRASVISAAASLDEEKFEELCEDLSRRQHMVRWAGSYQFPNGTVSQRYEFAHALYREVFYRRQAPGRRAKLHLRIGERLEAIYAKHENEVATELAEHFEQGSDWTRAVKYLRVAADSARRRYAHREAVALLQHAAGLVSGLLEPDRVDAEIAVLEQLGMFYVALVNIPAALETYQTLVALAARHGRIDVEIRALLDMALPAAWTSTQLFVETNERALELSARQEYPLMRARTRASCFLARAVAGRWRAEDAERCREALEEIEAKADRLVVAEHVLGYAILQAQSSQYGKAYRKTIESIETLIEQDDLNQYFGVLYQTHHYWLPMNVLLWGNWGQALKEVQQTIALFEKNGEHARGQEQLLIAASVHLCAMDFSGVVAICESIFDSIRIPQGVRQWQILVGSAEAALGHHDQALEHLMKAKDEMDRQPLMNDWYNKMPLQAGFVELWLSKGDLVQAREEAVRFLDVALATAERTYQGLAWEANARVDIAGEDWKRAQECVEKALATIEGYEVPLAAWRIHGTAADLYTRAGNNDLVDHHCEFSRATIMKLADSMGAQDPLRAIFLSASPVRRILDKAEGISA
jgi:DNA-binding winged helix-turn-helix (wHTH) protein/tetratricopeptide (TPR) repeat protein